MRKILSLVCLLFLFTGISRAQEPRDTIHASSRVTGRPNMRDILGLSRDQAKKLKALNQDFRQQAEALKSDSTLDDRTRREKHHALMMERNRKMMDILTPEQQEKLRAYRKEHPRKREKES